MACLLKIIGCALENTVPCCGKLAVNIKSGRGKVVRSRVQIREGPTAMEFHGQPLFLGLCKEYVRPEQALLEKLRRRKRTKKAEKEEGEEDEKKKMTTATATTRRKEEGWRRRRKKRKEVKERKRPPPQQLQAEKRIRIGRKNIRTRVSHVSKWNLTATKKKKKED